MLFQKTIYDLSILANRYAMWADIFNSILVVLMIGYSSYMVLHKQILVGEMMAIIGISSGLFGAIARLSATNIQLQQAKVAFDRMFEFASLKPEYEKQEEAAKLDFKSINIKNLTFRFAGRPQLLKDISIKVSKGEVVSIQGEVGSGKSILMQILQKFYQPESGQITVKTSQKNYQWDELSTEQWRNIMAVVPQQIKIFNGTLLDNICLGNVQEEYQQVMEFCQKLGFDNYFFSLPQGYLTIIGEEGVNLSGGQQQLVALARAIYQKPQVLFLDEFTSGMDKRTEAFALQVLKNIKDEMAVIFITHRTQTALLADKVYILESGVIKSEEFAMVLN
jgi:ATP-binding cassette, subfamily C, bacteriocin exporter